MSVPIRLLLQYLHEQMESPFYDQFANTLNSSGFEVPEEYLMPTVKSSSLPRQVSRTGKSLDSMSGLCRFLSKLIYYKKFPINRSSTPRPNASDFHWCTDTLFFLFYMAPRDNLQLHAAAKLFEKGWRYNMVSMEEREIVFLHEYLFAHIRENSQ